MTMRNQTYNYSDDPGRLGAGAEVYGADGAKIGHLVEATRTYLLVEKGWLFIKDLYIPTSSVAKVDSDGRIYLAYMKHEAEQIGREQLPSEGDPWYGTTATTGRTATGSGTDREIRTGEDISVPIVEEELKAGVRETEAGKARIVKDVRTEQKTLNVPVEREEVYITERQVNRPATEADLSMRDREIEIPLKEQEVVATKEARVTGEVNVRKEVKRDTKQVTDTVRREDVHVEGADTDRVHVKGLTDAQRRRFDTMGYEDQRRYAKMSAVEREAYEREYDARLDPADRSRFAEPGTDRTR